MARPLRIEHEGACYDVMNRGKGGQRVFRGGDGYGLFLGRSRGRASVSDVGAGRAPQAPAASAMMLDSRCDPEVPSRCDPEVPKSETDSPGSGARRGARGEIDGPHRGPV